MRRTLTIVAIFLTIAAVRVVFERTDAAEPPSTMPTTTVMPAWTPEEYSTFITYCTTDSNAVEDCPFLAIVLETEMRCSFRDAMLVMGGLKREADWLENGLGRPDCILGTDRLDQ